MSVCHDCNKLNVNAISTLQDEAEVCQRIVHETVCVQGNVTITPSIVSGTITSFCLGNPTFQSCTGDLKRKCVFTVSQNICVEIPLTFSANAEAAANGIVCGDPEIGVCQGTDGCTHTRGFFSNNGAVVTELLGSDPIILGIGTDGFSFTVTTLADADTVYTNSVPGSPNPQYNQLYAQLLTANLNVRNLTEQGIAICDFALFAITTANDLLAMDEIQPNDVVSGIQEELATFNEGDAPGCPMACVE